MKQLLLKITAATKLFFILVLWCYFILRKLHFYQCFPANSLTSGTNYMPADTKRYDYIILVFTKQEIDMKENL